MLAKSKELIIIVVILGIAGVMFFFGLARYKDNVAERNKAVSDAVQKTEIEEVLGEATTTAEGPGSVGKEVLIDTEEVLPEEEI